jgi:hypothetical protein
MASAYASRVRGNCVSESAPHPDPPHAGRSYATFSSNFTQSRRSFTKRPYSAALSSSS